MKIAIIGQGKMGRLIEEMARKKGFKISCIIDCNDHNLFSSKEFAQSDVAIEFSTPSSAPGNILAAFAAKVPVVCGTTGWLDALPEIKKIAFEGKGTILWSSNFSIGMNIFMALNSYLASMMNAVDNYKPEIEEIHHIHKLDHPSGTAISLAQGIIETFDRVKDWFEPADNAKSDNKNEIPENLLPIYHKREGEVPGIHTITWESGCDMISITHSAKSREGFALGALEAAEWLHARVANQDKTGFFTMQDMMKDILSPGKH